MKKTSKIRKLDRDNFISKVKFLLGILLCILTNVTAEITYSAENNLAYSSVIGFIHDQKVIRIAMSDSGGYGDLTASMNVMDHLREMGFENNFEVIYPDTSTEKIVNLFELPSDIPNVYEDTSNKIRFIKLNEFIKQNGEHKIDLVPFGITGALWAWNDAYMDDTHNLKNLADFLNVKTFAWINPWVTNAFSLIIKPAFILIYTSHQDPLRFDASNSYILASVPTLSQVTHYLQQSSYGQNLIVKDPALTTFIKGMKNKYFNVLSVYGWTVSKKWNVQYNNDSSPGNILQILTGARYAQINGPDDLRTKPLVIAVFYDYTEESTQLEQAIHHNNWDWSQQNNTGIEAVQTAIKQLGLDQPGVFSIASISSVDTITQLQNLQPGQILLLSMGPLPKIVFDGLYAYTGDNILPQIREGMGSLSSLIRTGRPHIHCGDIIHEQTLPPWELGFDLISDPSLKERLQDFYSHFCGGMQTWQEHNDIYKKLGELIIDSQNRKSAFSAYFRRLKEEASKPENDRIYRAIEEVIKLNQ